MWWNADKLPAENSLDHFDSKQIPYICFVFFLLVWLFVCLNSNGNLPIDVKRKLWFCKNVDWPYDITNAWCTSQVIEKWC